MAYLVCMGNKGDGVFYPCSGPFSTAAAARDYARLAYQHKGVFSIVVCVTDQNLWAEGEGPDDGYDFVEPLLNLAEFLPVLASPLEQRPATAAEPAPAPTAASVPKRRERPPGSKNRPRLQVVEPNARAPR